MVVSNSLTIVNTFFTRSLVDNHEAHARAGRKAIRCRERTECGDTQDLHAPIALRGATNALPFVMGDDAARIYAENVTSRDGTALLIRALRSSDRQLLAAFFLKLSPQSIRYRVFAAKSTLTEKELTYLVELDFTVHVGLVAVVVEAGEERVVGVGRYCRVPALSTKEASDAAEIALTVLDECQGHGIGTLLLEHLARIARARGISEFEADVMFGNTKMMQVFADSGFVMHKSLDEGIFHLSFPTSATQVFLDASHARELNAAAPHDL